MSNASRRDLLKGAGLAGLGGLSAAKESAAAPSPKNEGGSHWERPATQKGNNLNLNGGLWHEVPVSR